MQPRIDTLEEKKLVGYALTMNLAENKTGQLWRQFAPRIKEINNRCSEDKISMQIYNASYFDNFNAENEFEKWATVEVKDFSNIPSKMKSFVLQKGLYAVFNYKGSSSDTSIYTYIFSEWIPNSPYQIDNRPHFEILGEKYKNNHPDSEEEIWIPIKDK